MADDDDELIEVVEEDEEGVEEDDDGVIVKESVNLLFSYIEVGIIKIGGFKVGG
jgi:hypothetical protein